MTMTAGPQILLRSPAVNSPSPNLAEDASTAGTWVTPFASAVVSIERHLSPSVGHLLLANSGTHRAALAKNPRVSPVLAK